MDHAETKMLFSEGKIVPKPIPYEEAEKFLGMRVPLTKEEWEALDAKLRFRAFVVSRLTELDAIEAVKKRLEKALKEGKTLSQFWEEAGRDELLRRAGFHRSNPWYWETVFRTNIQTAYNTGRAYQFRKNPPAYLEFVGINDARQTRICRARNGIIKKADDPFWAVNWPPLHFNCRSTVRAVHQEEFEALGLEKTMEEPSEKPAKGFGLNPLNTGLYWKMTPAMVERAKKYGLMDEIEKAARELGLEIKEIYIKTPQELLKVKNLIDQYEYHSIEEVEELIKDFWKRYPEYFRSSPYGFQGFQVWETKEHFMAARVYEGTIHISDKTFPEFQNFNPKNDLLNAFKKMKAGEPLTFLEEEAISFLWHEINHLRVKRPFDAATRSEVLFMETINELVARHTYPEFMKKLGAKVKPLHQKKIIEEGYGYTLSIKQFRKMLKKFALNEKKIIKELEPLLIEDYNEFLEKTAKKIAELTGKREDLIKTLLQNYADLDKFESILNMFPDPPVKHRRKK